MMTSFTSSAGTLDLLSASRMAIAPSSGALSEESAPRNFPIGVRAAPTITGVRDLSGIVTSSTGLSYSLKLTGCGSGGQHFGWLPDPRNHGCVASHLSRGALPTCMPQQPRSPPLFRRDQAMTSSHGVASEPAPGATPLPAGIRIASTLCWIVGILTILGAFAIGIPGVSGFNSSLVPLVINVLAGIGVCAAAYLV